MRIKEVCIKNFRGYGENLNDPEGFFRFKDLNNSLVLLSGYNGFGKTSFFDAIEWCITDRLNRIQNLQNIMKLDNLKKSNYLKFHNKTEKDENRVVEVSICFEDGIVIKRSSKSNSIDEADYKSEFLSDISLLSDKLLYDIDEDNLGDVFRTNFLSQENMNGILRAKDPAQRTDEFLKLLGLDSIKKISDKSQIRKLPSVINKISKKLVYINDSKKELEDIFANNGWGNFEEYKVKVKGIIKEIAHFEEKCIYLDEKIIKKESDFEYYDVKQCINEVNNCILKLNIIINKYIRYSKILDLLVEEFLINKMINLYGTIKSIMFLKENNISELTKINYIDKIIYYKKNLRVLETEFDKCDGYRDLWNKFLNKREKNKMTNRLLEEFIDKSKETFEFIKLFGKYSNNYDELNELKKTVKLNTWKKILKANQKYILNISKINDTIESEKELIKISSEINDKYVTILYDVRKYIDDKNLDYCPICFNNDFSKYNKDDSILNNTSINNKEKLINIIDITVKGSNKEIELAQKKLEGKIETLKNLQKIYQEKIVSKVLNNFKGIRNLYNSYFCKIEIKLQWIINCHSKHINTFDNKSKKIENRINAYKKIYKIVFDKDFKDISEKEIENIQTENIEVILNKMEENYNKKYGIYDLNIDILKERLNTIEKLLGNYNEEKNMSLLKKKINELNKIINIIQKITPYEFITKNKEMLEEYVKYSKKEDNLKTDLNELEKYKTYIDIINRNSIIYQRKMIEERLDNNPLIQFIYEKINPHPFFRKIKIDYSNARGGNKWINIMDDSSENIFLDHIFSSAQLNILALSIFLGLSLNQKISKLKQFFLDDPIQSMDDINILTFIDLLRAIINSKSIDSNIILSTHESNFAKLLSIKMRNNNVKIFQFIGYGEEGPKIKVQ
ncbi:AAA family ATPase [Clostridium drakei]|uniref:Nuclease SbcCD subunit C n=1 Tax=Clostridium drakei TaxID=332101 RepID=A0A2U8DUB5_9CLOT|nr:AAA family ATPase [Clostridium drakei]AWI06337.1 hypothetical protein B9W14_18140 [Clostridium drakei]